MKNLLKGIFIVIFVFYSLMFAKEVHVLSFVFVLLASVLLIYIINYKNFSFNCNNKNVMIIIFFIIAILPALYITKENYSKIENRMYAPYKPLLFNFMKKKKSVRINMNYGKHLSLYFTDRFFLRNFLVNKNRLIKYKLSNHIYYARDMFINKKTNWIFDRSIDQFGNLSSEDLSKIYNSLNKLQKYLDINNTKLYIVVSPYKSLIYPKETKVFEKIIYKHIKDTNRIIEKIKQNTNCNIIYTYEDLVNAKKDDYIYFKTDIHLTDYASYIVYKKIASEIKKDFPNFKIISLDNFNVKTTNSIRSDFARKYRYNTPILNKCISFDEKNIENKFLDTYYRYYDYKYEKKTLLTTNIEEYKKYFYTKENPKLKVLVLGQSISDNIMGFLPYSVSDLLYYRLNNRSGLPQLEQFKIYKRFFYKDIKSFKPDILIIIINTKNLFEFGKYFMEEK